MRCFKRDEAHVPVLLFWRPGFFAYERMPVCRPCVAKIRKDDALRAWESWDDEEIEREFGEWPMKGITLMPEPGRTYWFIEAVRDGRFPSDEESYADPA